MNRHSAKTRHHGPPKKLIIHHEARSTTYLLVSKQQEKMTAAQAQRRPLIQGMSQADRDAVEQMDIDLGNSSADVMAASSVPPLGGKVTILDGGERFEAPRLNYKRVDDRIRTDRIKIQNEHWALQWDRLVDAFLAYCAKEYDDGLPPQNDDVPPPDTEGVFSIDAVDIFSWRRPTFLPITGESWANETLIRYGYVGSAPLQPSLAISIRALEAYRESHELCPQFSMATQCKALCRINGVTYRNHLAVQFKIAYDAYLEICRRAEARRDAELGDSASNDKAPLAATTRMPRPLVLQINGRGVQVARAERTVITWGPTRHNTLGSIANSPWESHPGEAK
ncbi:hypothetical protein BD779DRAFT_1803452 [Infundibulicybe gibba]|nr:hypothetical protein BD779DRAFT_1803452 [Infundibulicybe gibba]